MVGRIWKRLYLEKLRVDRKKIFEELEKEGLGVQVHYLPLHLQPFYRNKFGYKKGDLPIAERYLSKSNHPSSFCKNDE